ncbi:TraR/DksA C4-type zinc finger protein [Hafnia alvei]|nr:TraR/DksA C4-type zinc finger protein [Hafnia alvei]
MPPKRRQAIPGVSLCVECQRAMEIMTRRYQG